VDQYREGKVGSTPNRGVKENLKPFVYKRSEPERATAREQTRNLVIYPWPG